MMVCIALDVNVRKHFVTYSPFGLTEQLVGDINDWLNWLHTQDASREWINFTEVVVWAIDYYARD